MNRRLAVNGKVSLAAFLGVWALILALNVTFLGVIIWAIVSVVRHLT